MNYSKNTSKIQLCNSKSVLRCEDEEPFAPQDEPRKQALRGSFTSSLTTYKEVVYNFKEYQKDYEQIQK